MQPQLKYILGHATNASGGTFCSLALGGKCGHWEDVYNWNVDFSGRPNDVKPDFVPPTPPKVCVKNSVLFKFLNWTSEDRGPEVFNFEGFSLYSTQWRRLEPLDLSQLLQ